MLQEAAFCPAVSSYGASWGLAGSPRPVGSLTGPEQRGTEKPGFGWRCAGPSWRSWPVDTSLRSLSPSSCGHLPVWVCLKPPSLFCWKDTVIGCRVHQDQPESCHLETPHSLSLLGPDVHVGSHSQGWGFRRGHGAPHPTAGDLGELALTRPLDACGARGDEWVLCTWSFSPVPDARVLICI